MCEPIVTNVTLFIAVIIRKEFLITNLLKRSNEQQLFELVTRELLSERLYCRILENATMTNEHEINFISFKIFQNVNRSAVEDGRETSDRNFKILTDLMKKYDLLRPNHKLMIGE